MKRSRFYSTLFALVSMLIVGCAQLGLQTPKTPEDGFRYTQTMMTGVYTTLGNAAADGTLPAADARKYHTRLEKPYQDMQLVDKAVRASGGTVPADMVGRLNLAMGVLNDVAAELKKRLPPATTKALPPVTMVPAAQ